MNKKSQFNSLFSAVNLIFIFTLTTIVGFQNCSQVKLKAYDSLLQDSTLPQQSNLNGNNEENGSPPKNKSLFIEDVSFFSKSKTGNGYEIVATFYTESIEPSSQFITCINSSSKNDPFNNLLWTQPNISSCNAVSNQPLCHNGAKLITTAIAYDSKYQKYLK